MQLGTEFASVQDIEVTINDDIINKKKIFSYEIRYRYDSPIIDGAIFISNVEKYENVYELEKAKISIYCRDKYGEDYKMTFRCSSFNNSEDGLLILVLIDEFSYTLLNSTASYSFNGNIIGALKKYLEGLQITSYPIFYPENDAEICFTIEAGQPNLNSFMTELIKSGYVCYQERDGVHIKSYDEVKTSSLETCVDSDAPLVYNKINYEYIYRIFDYNSKQGEKVVTGKVKSYAFDVATKSMVFTDIDIFDDIKLNDNAENISTGQGTLNINQSTLDPNQSKMKIRLESLEAFNLGVVVNGNALFDVNRIFNVLIVGSEKTVEDLQKGNISLSGNYISKEITDKYQAGRLIQRIYLGRMEKVKNK